MTKHSIMQRMFIQIKMRLIAYRLSSVEELIKHYKVEIDDKGRVRGDDFLKILGRMGVIRNHMADDIEIILDEYQDLDQDELKALREKRKAEQGLHTSQNESKAKGGNDSMDESNKKKNEDDKEKDKDKDD